VSACPLRLTVNACVIGGRPACICTDAGTGMRFSSPGAATVVVDTCPETGPTMLKANVKSKAGSKWLTVFILSSILFWVLWQTQVFPVVPIRSDCDIIAQIPGAL